MIIPREANLVRFYVQLQTTEGGQVVSIARDKATQDICIARAKKIFEPFELEFGYIDWFSVYQIGQRIASRYTLDHRVILGGDAVRAIYLAVYFCVLTTVHRRIHIRRRPDRA
jgi:hypothetical protein